MNLKIRKDIPIDQHDKNYMYGNKFVEISYQNAKTYRQQNYF